MIKVLNKGYVDLVDHMGGDQAVIDSARRCWRSTPKGEDADKKLIRHLLRKEHKTPFEAMTFRFDIKCPLFVARQWVRHRMAGLCEESLRYCVANREYYIPEGTEGLAWIHVNERQFDAYQDFLCLGMPKEQARSVLPIGIYTTFYWFVNGSSLLNFLKLRTDKHAQKEMQAYAKAIMCYLQDIAPITAKEWKKLEAKNHTPVKDDGGVSGTE